MKTWTTEEEELVAELLFLDEPIEAIQKVLLERLGVDRGYYAIRDARTKRPGVRSRLEALEGDSSSNVVFDPRDDTVTIDGEIPTETDILEKAGLDPKYWEVEKLSIQIRETPSGARATQTWAKLNRLKRKKTNREMTEEFVAGVCDTLEQAVAHVAPVIYPGEYTQRDRMVELMLPDLHLQKYGWAPEVGEDYDTIIASRRFVDAYTDLLSRIQYTPERVLLPIGNDFFQFDSMLDGKVPTTYMGTPQDADGRWQRGFQIGIRLISDLIRTCLTMAPEVYVMVVPGNHDTQKMFYLGEVLSAAFSFDPRVTVNNEPNIRKYLDWGSSALGFTHGKNEKIERLGSIMAVEFPGRWQHREFHVGHLHRREVLEDAGVCVRRFMSLSGTDAWHHENGFIGAQMGATALEWDKRNGPLTEHHYYHRQEVA